MAQATVELRNLLKTDFELFDFDYTFDDREYAKQIEQAVIDYYYFEEIGQETPDRFKHVFETRFKRVIGYYNKLYNTTLLEYNPLINYSMNEALEKLGNATSNVSTIGTDEQTATVDDQTSNTSQTNGNTDSTTNETESGSGQSSDYPQDTITGDYRSEERKNDVEREQTQGTTSEQTTTGSSEGLSTSTGAGSSDTQQESTSDNTESYEKTIEGLTGRTYQELIQLERESLLRITSMIIQELKPCFILTY